MSVLKIENLHVSFVNAGGEVPAVRDFSLAVQPGECVGVVGESGAGKSQAFLAVMGLLPRNARVAGSARFGGIEMLGRRPRDLDSVRGAGITMVFQDPLTSLTPHLKIGEQLAEHLVQHRGLTWRAAQARGLELLNRVHVTDPQRRLDQYPHELSGGMRQRVLIAIALACDPALVIADEPTTALDVTIQAQILSLLAELKRERGMSLVLITHDLGVVAGIADRVVVMQAGRIVEQGTVGAILKTPTHEHTRALLQASSSSSPPPVPGGGPGRGHPILLTLSDLSVQFNTRAGPLRALDGVDFNLHAGESIGIVGESGSGKSTLARAILQLIRPTAGQTVWLGRALKTLSPAELRKTRADLQLVFQDPLASLNPRMTVAEIVTEPLRVHRPDLNHVARIEMAAAMLERVALPAAMLHRYPHELSGGQCQRVGIARAMILKPKLLICDEAVSALDVTTQTQIVELIAQLRREHGLALLFISHNLEIVRRLCDRVLVLYLGRMMELAPTAALYTRPAHPYTRSLIDAVPIPDPEVQPTRLTRALSGELPSPLSPPTGCVFHTRCPYVVEICRRQMPTWDEVADEHDVACHRWRELSL